MSVADVEAEDVLLGLSLVLGVLDVEDVLRRQVVHREGGAGGDDPRAALGASCWMGATGFFSASSHKKDLFVTHQLRVKPVYISSDTKLMSLSRAQSAGCHF